MGGKQTQNDHQTFANEMNHIQSYTRELSVSELTPAMRVHFILGEEGDKAGKIVPRPVFSEMEEFKSDGGTTDGEWKEIAR